MAIRLMSKAPQSPERTRDVTQSPLIVVQKLVASCMKT